MRCTIRPANLLVPLLAVLEPGLAWADPPNVPLCTAGNHQALEAWVPDGQGGALAVWLDRRYGADLDLYVRRVTATGAPADGWPQDGAPACLATGDQTAADIAADGWGGAFVVWQDRRTPDHDVRIQHLDPFGRLTPGWPADGLVVCGAPGGQSEPRVAADTRGGAFIVWSDNREPPATDIYIQHVDAYGVLEPRWPADGAPLCAIGGIQRRATIAEDGSGGVLVVWEDARHGANDIYAQRVPADLLAHFWGANGIPICRAIGEQERPRIAPDGAGGAYIVWQDLRGNYYDIFAQHLLEDGYYDWGWGEDGSAVCTSTGGQLEPQITSDGSGGAIVTWFDSRGGATFDIYAMRLTTHAASAPGWVQNGVALCRAPGDQIYPQIGGDGEGGAFVTWTDWRNGSAADIYVQRITAIGIVPACWPGDGLAVCSFAAVQESPIVVGNGRGRGLVAWTDWRSGATADIYAASLPTTAEEVEQPVDGTLAVEAAADQLPSSSRTAVEPQSDGVGGAFVAWEDTRGGGIDVYAQRLRIDGRPAPGWPAGGVALGVPAAHRAAPVLASDGAGGVFVAWQEESGGATGYDIRVQRLGPNGVVAAGWPPAGVAACAALGAQLFPSLATSTSGSVFVVWQDFRNGAAADIYAIHIGANGARVAGWPENGLGVCTEAGNQQHTAAVASSSSGVLLFWSDERSGAQNVYGIGLNAAGGLESNWGFGGTPLCDAAGDQHSVVAIPDGASGAFLAWLDERSGASAAFATRISRFGNRLPGWLEDGTSVTAPEPGASAEHLRITSDAGDGVVIAWSVRLATTYDVRVQRLQADATRAPGWPAAGARVATTPGTRLFPGLAPDGAGGAMVVWVDLRAGAPDVYAQHLTSGGNRDPAWSADGLPVCAAPGPQWAAGIVVAPGCGTLAVWHDGRGGDADLYAARVPAVPMATDAVDATPIPTLLGAAPNPFRETTAVHLPAGLRGPVEVDIYDAAGRHVRRLLRSRSAVPPQPLVWDGRDEVGARLAAGTYFVRLRSPGLEARAKVVRRR